MKQLDIIKATSIQHLSIEVTSVISKKYLIDFFKTQFDLNGIVYNNTDMVYYNFIKSLKIYEILLFPSISSTTIIEPLLPSYYTKGGLNIFIFEYFFVIFKDKNFFAYKSIQNKPKEDIVLYVEQTYDISIDHTIVVDKNLYKILLTNKPKKIKYIKLSNNIAFGSFILFVIVCSIIFGYLFNLKNNKTISFSQNNLYEKLDMLYKQYNPNISNNLIEFLKYLKLFKIQVEQINYSKKSLSTVLLQKDKTKLYDLFAKYQKIKIKSIIYDNEKNLYKMDIKIEF